MGIKRQGISFLLVGCGLIAVDWAVFVLLSAMGTPPAWANVVGRVAGALVGYAANGGITFRTDGAPKYGARRFARYVMVWAVLTLLSTALVAALADRLNLQIAWLAKPVVEAGLAVVSFFISRHWVYV